MNERRFRCAVCAPGCEGGIMWRYVGLRHARATPVNVNNRSNTFAVKSCANFGKHKHFRNNPEDIRPSTPPHRLLDTAKARVHTYLLSFSSQNAHATIARCFSQYVWSHELLVATSSAHTAATQTVTHHFRATHSCFRVIRPSQKQSMRQPGSSSIIAHRDYNLHWYAANFLW